MIDTAIHTLLLDIPRAAATWLGLLMLAVIALAVLVTRTARWRAEDVARIRETVRRRRRVADEARDLDRYATEVAIAADRAGATAARRRTEWLAAQDAVEAAWQVLDRSEAEARRLTSTMVFGAPRTPHTPAEYADRERFLHRAAITACFRQELPVLELSEVLANRNGWDPRRHPVEQEIILSRFVRDGLLAAYRAAATREREAWRAAEVAAASAQTLRDEAFVAAERAEQVRRWLPQVATPARSTATATSTAITENTESTETTEIVSVRVWPVRPVRSVRPSLAVGMRRLASSSH